MIGAANRNIAMAATERLLRRTARPTAAFDKK
jgi:hypothetical protein